MILVSKSVVKTTPINNKNYKSYFPYYYKSLILFRYVKYSENITKIIDLNLQAINTKLIHCNIKQPLVAFKSKP